MLHIYYIHVAYILYYIHFHDFKILYLIMTDDIPSQLVKTFCSNVLKIKIQAGPEWHNTLQKLA